MNGARGLKADWATPASAWRDPADVVSWTEQASRVDPSLLRLRSRGRFWDVLAERQLTLIVTREYEHLVMGLALLADKPHVTHLPLPHPSGVAFDARAEHLHVAATRNPNQLVTLAPLAGTRDRADSPVPAPPGRPLLPIRTWFLPGRLYLHELALVGGRLHGNAVGENTVVRFQPQGEVQRVWWPKTIENTDGPDFSRNYLQLNSIAAGRDLRSSFFSASAERPGRRRPGHRNFPVDGRGVIFSGRTREPIARGLTRPHSARLRDGLVWVANSGYGTIGYCSEGKFTPHVRLPGWTRGLCLAGEKAFVATSRVIPRFRQYAPGLELNRSECAVHAIDLMRGTVEGSLIWPAGNQIFGVEAVPTAFASGFLHQTASRPSRRDIAQIYYSFDVGNETHE